MWRMSSKRKGRRLIDKRVVDVSQSGSNQFGPNTASYIKWAACKAVNVISDQTLPRGMSYMYPYVSVFMY